MDERGRREGGRSEREGGEGRDRGGREGRVRGSVAALLGPSVNRLNHLREDS